MLKSLHLPLSVHPHATSPLAIERALAFAGRLEAHVSAFVEAPRLSQPVSFHPYGMDTETRHAGQQALVDEAARALAEAARVRATELGVAHRVEVLETQETNGDDPIVGLARLFDLTIAPYAEGDAAFATTVQALAFDSGRPILLLPENGGQVKLDSAVVAWDFGRSAARALSDAMPLLVRAGEVRIVVVANEKDIPEMGSAPLLVDNLVRNGVKARMELVERGNRTVGATIDAAAASADLLVMGAFGHSRLRNFFLGGATRHVLERPLLPTLLAN